MTNEQSSLPTITAEERHVYTVDIAVQPTLVWERGQVHVCARVPYDGRLLLSGVQPTNHAALTGSELRLGDIVMTSPVVSSSLGDGVVQRVTLPVVLPANSNLLSYIQSDKCAVVERKMPIAEPQSTLITVAARVSDAASVSSENTRAVSQRLIDSSAVDFSQDLVLTLSIELPNLDEEQHQAALLQEASEIQREQQSTRQVILEHSRDLAALAQHLAALGNNPGGGRLIFANRAAERSGSKATSLPSVDEISGAVLQAALRSSPPVVFSVPRHIRTPDGRELVRVLVAGSVTPRHRIGSSMYRRVADKTVAEPAPGLARSAPPIPVGQVVSLLTAPTRDDIVVLDGSTTSLDALDLGPAISALINTSTDGGTIIIRNVRAPVQPSLWSSIRQGFTRQENGVRQHLEARLQQELERCTPQLTLPRIELLQQDSELVAFVHVPPSLAPIALYSGQGYCWQNGVPILLSSQQASDLYHRRTQTSEAAAQAHIVYGELGWPIQPSVSYPAGDSEEVPAFARYDIRRQAMTWNDVRLTDMPETGWTRCDLHVPLRDVLTAVDEQGAVRYRDDGDLTGRLLVHVDNALPCGWSVTPHPSHAEYDWFGRIAVVKRTVLQLNLTVRTQELFRRRTRGTQFRFALPDVMLDHNRLADIQQACADLGFKIYDVAHERAPGFLPSVRLRGIRNRDYCDIIMEAFFICTVSRDQSRQLRFVERTDSKNVPAAKVDATIWLWGTGGAATSSITDLHVQLHRVLTERLSYLRVE